VRVFRFRHAIYSHRLSSVQLVKTLLQRFLVEVVRQAVKLLVPIPGGQPSYPLQFRGRCQLRFCWSHNVSLPRTILSRGLRHVAGFPCLGL